jgi:hypothetical protein
MHRYVCVCVHVSVHSCIDMCVCVCVCMSGCMHAYMYAYVDVVCVYLCMCEYYEIHNMLGSLSVKYCFAFVFHGCLFHSTGVVCCC